MKVRIIFFLLFFLLIGGNLTLSYFFLAKNKSVIFSPLSNKASAKALGVISTQTTTATTSPTITSIPPTPTPIQSEPTETPTPTSIPVIVAPSDLDELFTKYSNEYSVDKELMKRIAHCESGLNPGAATSLYGGLYQFSESLWISTRSLMGHDSDPNLRFSAEESIRTAAFMISQNHLDIWPNCNT